MFRQYFRFLGVKIVLTRTVDVLIKPQPEKGKEDMKFDIAAAERALEFVAQNNGVTVEEVREEEVVEKVKDPDEKGAFIEKKTIKKVTHTKKGFQFYSPARTGAVLKKLDD